MSRGIFGISTRFCWGGLLGGPASRVRRARCVSVAGVQPTRQAKRAGQRNRHGNVSEAGHGGAGWLMLLTRRSGVPGQVREGRRTCDAIGGGTALPSPMAVVLCVLWGGSPG